MKMVFIIVMVVQKQLSLLTSFGLQSPDLMISPTSTSITTSTSTNAQAQTHTHTHTHTYCYCDLAG